MAAVAAAGLKSGSGYSKVLSTTTSGIDLAAIAGAYKK